MIAPGVQVFQTTRWIELGPAGFEVRFTFECPCGGPVDECEVTNVEVLSMFFDGKTKHRHEDLTGFYVCDIAVLKNLTTDDTWRIFREDFSDIAI